MLSFFKQSPIGALFGGNLSDGELSGGDLSDGELSGGELFRVSVCPVELPGGELSYT